VSPTRQKVGAVRAVGGKGRRQTAHRASARPIYSTYTDAWGIPKLLDVLNANVLKKILQLDKSC